MDRQVRARSASGTQSDVGALEEQPKDFPPEAKAPQPGRLRVVCYVLLWYAFSISLSVYNKWMFAPEGLNFPFPVFTTSLHQLVQAGLAWCTLKALHMGYEPFSARAYLRQVFPCAMASSGDIGLGNLSLQFVTLSFYTMVKSSALGFVLLFSVLFGLESPSVRLGVVICVLTVGVFMMVAGETQFSVFGFVLVLSAACSSGLRWALTKLLLEGRFQARTHPVQTILMLSPGMFCLLFVWAMLAEGPSQFLQADLWSQYNPVVGFVLVLTPGVLAYCMTWSEFQLLSVTGALTLAVAGICKEVATIIVSVLVFGDRLSIVNTAGLLVTIAAIAAYHQVQATNKITDGDLELNDSGGRLLQGRENPADPPQAEAAACA